MNKINPKTGKMEKFLEMLILPKLTQNKLENLTSLGTLKEIESEKEMKIFLQEKCQLSCFYRQVLPKVKETDNFHLIQTHSENTE